MVPMHTAHCLLMSLDHVKRLDDSCCSVVAHCAHNVLVNCATVEEQLTLCSDARTACFQLLSDKQNLSSELWALFTKTIKAGLYSTNWLKMLKGFHRLKQIPKGTLFTQRAIMDKMWLLFLTELVAEWVARKVWMFLVHIPILPDCAESCLDDAMVQCACISAWLDEPPQLYEAAQERYQHVRRILRLLQVGNRVSQPWSPRFSKMTRR